MTTGGQEDRVRPGFPTSVVVEQPVWYNRLHGSSKTGDVGLLGMSQVRVSKRKLLSWIEPKVVSRQRYRDYRRQTRTHIIIFVCSAAAGMFLWYVARFSPRPTPTSFLGAVAAAVLLGCFNAYVVPWLLQLAPREVIIHSARVTAQRAGGLRAHKVEDLVGFFIQSQAFDHETVPVLTLLGGNGSQHQYGVADDVSLTELKCILVGLGIPEVGSPLAGQ